VKRWIWVALVLSMGACSGAAGTSSTTAATPTATARPTAGRPSAWAEPISRPGLPNLHRVSAALYRSAQPTAEGMREASKLGVRTVVNLRSLHSDRDELRGLSLRYQHIHAKAWHPEDEDVVRFLRIVANPDNQPVLVHCQHGADRTGMMTAMYRVIVQGWTKDDAIAEMTGGDFGFHEIWGNLVDYVRRANAEQLAREAGLDWPPPRRREQPALGTNGP
jgi:protein tyrosine/serine phosphatase